MSCKASGISPILEVSVAAGLLLLLQEVKVMATSITDAKDTRKLSFFILLIVYAKPYLLNN
jgi:hypothetical protein